MNQGFPIEILVIEVVYLNIVEAKQRQEITEWFRRRLWDVSMVLTVVFDFTFEIEMKMKI